jgi:hypothetical protein
MSKEEEKFKQIDFIMKSSQEIIDGATDTKKKVEELRIEVLKLKTTESDCKNIEKGL